MVTNERRAPVQGEWHRDPIIRRPSGTISWSEHLSIYDIYSKKFGTNQSAERIADRGGFGYNEIICLTGNKPKTWEPCDQHLWHVAKPVDGKDGEQVTPQRIQLRRVKGWRKPGNTVVVSRPSKWGNPFSITQDDDECEVCIEAGRKAAR